jgi:hypothetical protein
VLEPYERAVQPITPPVISTQSVAPALRKSPRNPLLDGDDATDDSRNNAP